MSDYMIPRVAVIGAGAAGMMAAITAAELGAQVTVFERKHRRKIREKNNENKYEKIEIL